MDLDSRNLSSGVWEQQKHRPACASAQSGQHFYYSLFGSIISRLAMSEISILYIVSVAEQAGLNLTVGNPEDRFSHVAAHISFPSL